MLSLLLLLTALTASAESDTAVPLFTDLALAGGFRLSAVDSSMKPVEVGTVLARDAQNPPQWRLAQWGTRFSLADVQPETVDGAVRRCGGSLLVLLDRDNVQPETVEGAVRLANPGKEVWVLPGGLSGEGVILTVYGGVEYDGKLRQSGEAWPHLLIEQKLDAIRVQSFEQLNFQTRFMVHFCRLASKETPDPGLHTAHVTAFFTVHNMNPASPDYREMIWFGMPLFDARYPVPPGHQALDVGKNDATGKFICTIAGDRFYSAPVAQGVWHRLACDMKPLLLEALGLSQAKGYLTQTNADDLALTSFNLGWETPGPYDCSIQIKELKLEGLAAASE